MVVLSFSNKEDDMLEFNFKKFLEHLTFLINKYSEEEVLKVLKIDKEELDYILLNHKMPSSDILSRVCILGTYIIKDYWENTEEKDFNFLRETLDEEDINRLKKCLKLSDIKQKYFILSRLEQDDIC